MSVRFQISALVYMMVQAVLFGVGIVTVLATPLATYAATLIPVVVVVTAIGSILLSWWIAPRLRLRNARPFRS